MTQGLKAPPSGIRLDEKDAAIVKGMLVRGDRQHDIAAWFGVNGGRIGEISTSAKFAEVKPADLVDLPPQGPYLSGRQSAELLAKLGFSYAAE
ncbi:hypothetical protein [Sinisalibacter aestuarii]|uniref:Uncharacterized protein n=1 Tax=Sinisalibacter aestuarii TaxID=2949426 RepID=A0ABQ5LT86_9RHOB|nr:hypothetical protein [Sinisalibacter aestuarii]GKY88134.1 hypothetical protein STA1M1_20030 [Sinisalibacter aestuarii]